MKSQKQQHGLADSVCCQARLAQVGQVAMRNPLSNLVALAFDLHCVLPLQELLPRLAAFAVWLAAALEVPLVREVAACLLLLPVALVLQCTVSQQ